MNEEILQRLYENASSEFNMPDFETFKADMQDEEKLAKFRGNMASRFNIPDLETFRSDLGLKKKDESKPVQSPEVMDGQEVPTDTTLDSEQEPTEVGDSVSSSGDLVDIPMSEDDPRQQSFIDKKLAGGFQRAASGILSIPSLINQSLFTAVASDEDMKKVNELPPDQREDFINRVVNPLGMSEAAGIEARKLEEKAVALDQSMEQFETTIGQDIADGYIGQAAKRTAGEIAATIPSILQAMVPVAGITSIAAGAAGTKLRDIQKDGTELGGAVVGNAVVSGAAEGVFELFTRKQGKKILAAFGGKEVTEEGAKEFLTNIWKELGYGIGGEILSEEATYLMDKAADYLFRGVETEFEDAYLEMIDIAIISGTVGGKMAAGGAIPKMLHEKKVKDYIDQTIEGSKWTDLSEAFNQPVAEGINADQIKIAGMPYSKAFLEKALKQDVKDGLITAEDAMQSMHIFNKTQEYAKKVKNSNKPLTRAQLEKVVNLIKEKENLQGKIGSTDPALVPDEIARVKAIDEQLSLVGKPLAVTKEGKVVRETEVKRLKELPLESEDGATMNIDGTMYEDGGLVVPVDSKNMKASELTPEAIDAFIEENADKIGADNVKVGLYKFPNSDQVSIDLNIVVPPANRGVALEFGKEAGQESLFDLSTFENVKTGADGKSPKKFTPEQFNEISKALSEGRKPELQTVEVQTAKDEGRTLDEIMSEKAVKNKAVVKENVKKTLTALGKIAPNVKIKIFRSDKSFDKSSKTEGAAAFYDPTTKTIGININRADGTTVAHEAFHAILTEKIKDDATIQKVTQDMVKALEGTLSPELNQRLEDFIQNYDGTIQSEEKLAELVGILANNFQKMPKPKQTVVKKWLGKLAKVFGMKPFTDGEVVTVLNVIAKRLNTGQVITEGDISALNIKVKTGKAKGAKTTRYSKVMDALQKKQLPTHPNTKVQKNVPLSSIEGQTVSSTLSDKLFAGKMGDFKFLGGIGYPQVTGRFWASDSKGAANKIVNESKKSKDGYRYLLPAIMSNSSHISNKNSTIIATQLLKEAHSNGEFTAEEMTKQLEKTFSKINLSRYQPAIAQLTKTNDVNKMMDDLQNLMVNDMTFLERKDTLRSIIGEGQKAKYPTVGTALEFAKSIEEPMTSGAGLHDVVTVIRTKGNLKAVETAKDDEFYHESYGFHVESDQEIELLYLDGAYSLVDIIPEFEKESDGRLTSIMNELETKLGTPRGKTTWDIKAIRQNLGRTHGLSSYSAPIQILETRYQKSKKIDEIVKEGKDAGFTNKEIREFLKGKKYDMNQIDAALKVTKGNRELLDMFEDVKAMVNNNISDKNILRGYKTDKERAIVKGYIARARGMTAEEAASIFADAWAKSIQDQRKGKRRDKNVTEVEDAIEKAMVEIVDRQYVPKKILNNAGFENTVDFMVVGAGASSYAKNEYDKLYDSIYLGLTNKELNDLDKIIHLERIIAVDANRADRGLPPIRHQGGMFGEAATEVLAKMKKEMGDEAYNNLSKKANDYFQAYKDILKMMNQEGIIDDAAYEEFADVNYQPREYLEYLESLDGEFLLDEMQSRESVPLSQAQIKSMNLGSEGSQITDSKYLLQRTLLTRAGAVFSNRTNSTFAIEYKKQEAVVAELKKKKELTKKEKKIVENFERLESKVRFDEIRKFNDKGQPKYKMEKENTRGFTPIYYYENGVANRIWLEDEFHAAFTDTQKQYISGNAKEVISLITGQAAVTSIATGNNPAFFITNMPRDFMFTLTFSKEYGNEIISNTAKLTVDLTKGMGSALTRGKDFQLYIQYGGGMDYLSLQGKYKGTNKLNRAIDGVVSQKNQDRVTRNAIKKAIDRWNLASEAGMRVAVFNKSIKNQLKQMNVSDINTLSEAEKTVVYTKAVRSARELTDFNQGGLATKSLNSAIPYLNAATQGTRAAVENTKKRPVPTIIRMAQVVGYSTAMMLGASMYLIGKYKDMDDDEVKDLTRSEIYFKTIEEVSDYDLRNYFIIPLGYKDENGHWRYLRLAKAQAITPFINSVEHLQRIALSKYSGGNYKGDAVKIAMDAVRHNILPVDTGVLKRIPSVDASFAMLGIDGYTGNPLSWDRGKIPAELEGIVDDRVEPFYKSFGELIGESPLRFQSAMESFITTPSTNPYVGIVYALGNVVTPDGEPFSLEKDLGNIVESTVKRVIKSGSPYNVIAKAEQRVSEEIVDAYREHIVIQDEVKKAARKVKSGESTPVEILDTFTKIYEKEPLMMEKAKNWFKAELSKEKKHPLINNLKFERNKKVRAVVMSEYFGNVLTGGLDAEETRILKELKDNGAIDSETMEYYFNIFKED